MRVLVAGIAAFVMVGCGGGGLGAVVGGGTAYDCGPMSFTPDELEAAPPADHLRPDGRAALQGVEVGPVDPGDGWRVMAETGDELALIRELEQPQQNGPGDVRTHEFVRVARIFGATNVPDGAWVLDAAGTCTPRLDLGGLGTADLALATEPSPEDTEIELEVYERACASGRPADGRVEVVRQETTQTQVRLVVGVRPAAGDQECPGNPPTALTIHLDEPLGERTVVDASTLPPRPLEPSQPPDAGNDEAIERALAFEVPGSYVMDVEVSCFCPAGRFRVTVVDGEKVDVAVVDPDGDVVTDDAVPHPDLAPTMSEIQDRLRETLETGVVTEISVADDGRPVVVGLDPYPQAVDDEVTWVVVEWHVTER